MVGLAVGLFWFTLCPAVDQPENGPSADRGMFQRVIEEGRGGCGMRRPSNAEMVALTADWSIGVQMRGFD